MTAPPNIKETEMNKIAKFIAGLVIAAAAAFAIASPTLADCGCGDEGYYEDNYVLGWDEVGYDLEIYRGETLTFELWLDGGQTVDIGTVSEWIQDTYNVDLDITVTYPNGRVVTADEEGDDELTIRTGQGGYFTIEVRNYDERLGTNFYLYVS